MANLKNRVRKLEGSTRQKLNIADELMRLRLNPPLPMSQQQRLDDIAQCTNLALKKLKQNAERARMR